MAEETFWQTAAVHPMLTPAQVHLWRTPLQVPDDRLERCRRLLSAEEALRAQRFHFERDRRRFIVARGTLRTLLGAYLQADPARIELANGPRGKPAVVHPQEGRTLEFNLSHAADLAVYAFSLGRWVGVDVEAHRPLDDLRRLAGTVFSPHELAVLDSLPPAEQFPSFYACWTRKEAFIKAIGEGLYFPLDHFDVTLAPGEPARLLRVQGDPAALHRWQMAAFDPGAGFSGAVVFEGAETSLSFWHVVGHETAG
jgi:4'-phosphopantetheinyl transferase